MNMMDDSIDNPLDDEANMPDETLAMDADILVDVDPMDDGSQEIDIPHELPILPIKNSVAFPGTIMPINVGREKSKRLLDTVLTGSKLIGTVAQRHPETDDPTLNDLYRIGTACLVLKLLKLPDGTETLIIHGLARFGIESLVQIEPFWIARVNPYVEQVETSTEIDALMHNVRNVAERIIRASPNVPEDIRIILNNIDGPGQLADFLAANLSLGLIHRQELLETFGTVARLRKVHATLVSQLDVLELSQKLQEQVKSQIDASQRKYFLHEQLKAIQKELGETDAHGAELDELREKITAAKMPENVEAEAVREVERMERLPQASPDYGVSLDYVNWLCELPWSVSTEDSVDIKRARKILDQDHYGLDKIKKRILEFLAVRKLNPQGHSPILCFAGPPGVGKTSLGQSIARALGRKFIRVSLGGVRDEADIRGHRRTYIGSLPGRIIQEIRKAGSNNPVFMLDEVDKIGQDFRGDPASALLEVLDPAQNHSFTDHYLGVPFDLSKVMFIATANYMDPIPYALRDRMEIIALSGYTLSEKTRIAKQYLLPRRRKQNGLKETDIDFTDEAIKRVIIGYTREAGLRNLERELGSICRGVAAQIAESNRRRKKRITAKNVSDFLGPIVFESELALHTSEPGMVTGLAFTPVGGEILFIEATQMPGSGNLQLTGQLGDVMRESAQAAFSMVRSRAKQWKLDPKQLAETNVHIHVPAGAIPKDGPSAGVAMLTALVSLFRDQPVRHDVAMTGEITLRGLVMPIGGVKEKILAAHRSGIKTVILPARNKKDLQDVPAEIREKIKFVFATKVDQVLQAALADPTEQKKNPRKPPRKKKAARKSTRKKKTPRPTAKK